MGAYFLYIVFKYRNTVYGYRLRPDLPGPPGHPLVGHLWGALTRPRDQVLQNFTENHQKYGKVYTVTLPSVGRIINISDPEMLDHVLRVNFWAYEKGPRFKRVLKLLVGEGKCIFSADGEHWKWQRKLASNIFNVKAFRHYTSNVFCQEAEIVIEYLNKIADTDKAIDLQQLFYCFTLDSFGEIAFGQSFGCLKDPDEPVEFAAAFDRLNHGLSGRFISVISPLKDWWTGNGERLRNDSNLVRGFALDMIRERRRKQKEGQETSEGTSQKDLLQLFMDMKLDNGEVLSDDMLVDSVLNFVIAGRDTTAQALSWMFYLMHRSEADLNVWKRMVQETDEILAGSHPTYESTKQQKYAESCFYEALRLYPSVPKNIKTCVEDDVLPGGIRVYKGDRIGWCSWSMGRDTSIWGPDAKEYKPDRWLNSDKPSPAKFNAFHLGPRTCLGQHFATIEAITIMSMLAQKFTFELVDPKIEPAYMPSLTLPMAKGLPVRIKRRVDNA
ncbi:MAG: cytochrome P450 [Benniella sp.]|nr:MAG: cytochrome P450 [Benniella sp.]